MNRRSFLAFAALLLFIGPAVTATAQTTRSDGPDVALDGYDPVAYFTQGQPVQGSERFSANHNGVTYYFSNADDRLTFLSQPNKYAPQYGGFCAFGTAHGLKLSGDPKLWDIVDGKLYVTHNAAAMRAWQQDKPRYISRADEIWARIQARTATRR